MSDCFGVSWFGLCQYNPAAPATIYFSLGEAIGALAFTLAAQQLLRPVYRLRLAVRHLKISRIYTLVFSGVAAAFVASVLPSIPTLHGGPWGYSLVWELLAAALFVFAYIAVVVAIVRPIRLKAASIPQFARGVATLLSAATEADHLDVAEDVFESLATLIKAAAFLEEQDETSAFFDFSHRAKIDQSSYALSILGILADPRFCETLVKRAPWRLADAIRKISEKELHAEAAEAFVREVARQAIIRDESIVAREIEYRGFGNAPLLSDALFSNHFIVTKYNPLANCAGAWDDRVSAQLLRRFNDAAKRCYLTLIEHGDIGAVQAAFSIQSFYRTVFLHAQAIQSEGGKDHRLAYEMQQATDLAGKLAVRLLASARRGQYDSLFVTDAAAHRHDVLETLVEIVYEAIAGIANRYTGFNDPFWLLSVGVMHDMFCSIGSEPNGLTPFQQRLALKFSRRMKENIRGFYPAVTRVLLATVGPHHHEAGQLNQTAFNILKDVLYIHLKRFRTLAQRKPGGRVALSPTERGLQQARKLFYS
jgi:hypothetical protein